MTSTENGWEISGSYFEACNCDAICPCRSIGGQPGGRSSYGVCQFALSWHILHGHAARTSLDDRAVVMAGWYDDDDEPDSKWSVSLYVDDRSDDEQFTVLTDIFLGRVGGGTFQNFAQAIGTVHTVRRATITLSHEPRRWHFRAQNYVTVSATQPVQAPASVACGIPGLDRPGQEVISDQLQVRDGALDWDLRERCGFATDFRYAGPQISHELRS